MLRRKFVQRLSKTTQTTIALIAIMLALSACFNAGNDVYRLDGSRQSIESLDESISSLLEQGNVAGLSYAIINDFKVVHVGAYGYRDLQTRVPNDPKTSFSAASLSKTVFAYIVVTLAEDGLLDLDEPVQTYLERPLETYDNYVDLRGDDRAGKITARMVLSHTSGLPNWRFMLADEKLAILFEPGTKYSYSGEGYVLLQMVVEEITGIKLEDLAEQIVFGPIGMTNTSFVWNDEYEENYAEPHSETGKKKKLPRRLVADAAGGMQTTAADYAAFVVEVMQRARDGDPVVERMIRPQIPVSSQAVQSPRQHDESDLETTAAVSWSLGWGSFESKSGKAIFHTGNNPGYINYSIAFLDAGSGIVMLSNSENFSRVVSSIGRTAIGDVYSPYSWLGFDE